MTERKSAVEMPDRMPGDPADASIVDAVMPSTPFSQLPSNIALPSLDHAALGRRLRAYRLGAGLQAEDLADQLGVSRAVVYRIEKGEIVKLETLQRIASLLQVSLASLLGVEVEYYPNVVGLMERMRQLEQISTRIVSHFDPVSLLLTSDSYLQHLHTMLQEAAPTHTGSRTKDQRLIASLLSILAERKAYFERRRMQVISLIGLRDIERFLRTGMVGRLDLPASVQAHRIAAARAEVARIVDIMESEPMDAQIGLIDVPMPASTFQVFSGPERSFVLVSPFRFGELPNIHNGIGSVTASAEAVHMYEHMIAQLWKHASKGKAAAAQLRQLLERVPSATWSNHG